MVTLIIAEKPNVAKKIAHALAEKKPVRKTLYGVPYYELIRDGKRIIVAPAVGHLYTLAPKYKSYGYPIFDIMWVPVHVAEKGKSYAKDYIKALRELAKRANEFIVACDYDTEGEVIGYTALKYACGVEPERAKRMKFSALTKRDILKAWYNLEPTINFGMADAGIARHVLDWYWGVNLSRALTHAIKRASGKWMILSTGRVQGPTLKFLVEREKEIANFRPTPYWVIKMILEKNGKQYTATYEKERILDEEEAKRIVQEAKQGPAFVEKVEVKQQRRNPPYPFDLGTLQREAYSAFGYSPKKTLDIAQRLYEMGICSYPRTSSQKLPKNLNYKHIIQNLAKIPEYKPFAHELLGKSQLKPVEGPKEDPAHPAIYPTGELPGELTQEEKNIYDLIVRRFLAAFADPAVRETMKVVINSNNHRFILSGARTVKEGWIKIYGRYVSFDEVILPKFREGEPVRVIQIKREKKKTKPPSRYSPASVIKKMEDLGIGTKATRAQILETLYQRGYIEGKKKIKVTPLGMKVVEALEKNVPEIVSVELTKEFEEKMEEIMKRKLSKDKVVEEAKEQLIKILKEFKARELDIGRELMKKVIESEEKKSGKRTAKELTAKEEQAVTGWKSRTRDNQKEEIVVGKCPKCSGDLVVRYNKKTGKRFVGCSNWPNCDVTYPLLQRGEIIPTGKVCSECRNAPVVKIRERDREYEICLNMNCKKRRYRKGEPKGLPSKA
ncbi:MAG TPA: DNA topoisomerase I [Thermococcus paralvinellae]|uniref:DNA topoisomerase 1 n=1 Tax=Thermococcus paralvinellae TaxID=582419 RepID=A0A832ZI89_9EURY|nr:DNA topoisomerase I [Thermococcus paralvinellae]HIP89922.1 DNA topoisomerase I [Thermococcus paralvinellae]